MILDTSFGIIPLQKINDAWHVLLVQQSEGYWSFPKGHGEINEKPLDSAIRELNEETGLSVQEILQDDPINERYSFYHQKQQIDKTVYYFLASVHGILKIQEDEILSAKWVSLKDAEQHITFAEAKALCKEVIRILSTIEH